MRYVERNPVRGNFVELTRRGNGIRPTLGNSPPTSDAVLPLPAIPCQLRSWVNKPEAAAEVKALRSRIQRGLPFGDYRRLKSSTGRLSLEGISRSRGRLRNQT